jgi:UDP-N-acetylmuramyl tripeptide synthase
VCLINLLGDPAEDVERKLATLRAAGRIDSGRAECLNCGQTRATVRVAPGQTIDDVA